MSMGDQETKEFATAMLTAAEAGDFERLRDFYTPDAKLWFNTTDAWKTLEEHFGSAGGMRSKLKNMRYAQARIIPFENGYIQQFRAQATTEDGATLDMPVCIVIRMRDGKIHEREEYYDSAALQFLSQSN